MRRYLRYFGFVDPSGGSHDSMTLAIAHRSMLKDSILDGFWERKPPFSPDAVVHEFAAILEGYGIAQVTGDRYAGAWVAERFKEHHIKYVASEKTRSEIYLEFLALVNARRVRIPGNKRLRTQILALERRTSRSGRDTVDHPTGAANHDDLANSVCGVLCLAAKPARTFFRVEVLDVGTAPPSLEWRDPHSGVDLSDPFQGDERFWHKL